MTVWSDATGTLWPRRDGRDGPLPPLLVLLTVVAGLVDAASYLNLGHVFVANMTGNIIFLGFAIAGASGLSIWVSLVALGSFLVGSLAGGRLAHRFSAHRGALLRAALAAQLLAVVAGVIVAAAGGDPIDNARRYALTVVLAIAMGIQNATSRRLAVPDLTTTVLTMTLTGIAADSRLAGGEGSKIGRRLVAVAALLVGALIGGVLALHVDTAAPLAAAAVVVGIALVGAHTVANAPGDWAR